MGQDTSNIYHIDDYDRCRQQLLGERCCEFPVAYEGMWPL